MATEAAFPGADHHAGGGDRHPSRLLVCTVAQLAGADIGLRIRDAASGLSGPPSGETREIGRCRLKRVEMVFAGGARQPG
jgi:hypothetical protein